MIFLPDFLSLSKMSVLLFSCYFIIKKQTGLLEDSVFNCVDLKRSVTDRKSLTPTVVQLLETVATLTEKHCTILVDCCYISNFNTFCHSTHHSTLHVMQQTINWLITQSSTRTERFSAFQMYLFPNRS